jgi:hypothetical protein
MRFSRVLLASWVLCLAHAHAQRELLGKLVKEDDQLWTPIDNVSLSSDADANHDVTKDGGLFRLFLADSLKPGDEVSITVTIPGYAVYEPPGGKLTVPLDMTHRLEIRLLPIRSEGGQASQYLQQAVDAYRSALQVFTESAFRPDGWHLAEIWRLPTKRRQIGLTPTNATR